MERSARIGSKNYINMDDFTANKPENLTVVEQTNILELLKNLPSRSDWAKWEALHLRIQYWNEIQQKHFYISIQLAAYFRGEQNPNPWMRERLPVNTLEAINIETSRILQWSIVLFEADEYLRAGLGSIGFSYSNRIELLKALVTEWCDITLTFLTQDHAEIRTGRQIYDLQRALDHGSAINFELKNQHPDMLKLTEYCTEIIIKNKKHITSYKAWAEANGLSPNPKIQNMPKTVVVNQEILESKSSGNHKTNKATEARKAKAEEDYQEWRKNPLT